MLYSVIINHTYHNFLEYQPLVIIAWQKTSSD